MTIEVPGGKAEIFPDIGLVRTTYHCGHESNFMVFPKDHPEREEFERIAQMHGLQSAEQFAIYHELAHHFVAGSLGWKYSIVVWTDAHGARPKDTPNEYPYRSDDEEHLANRLLAFVFLDEPDPYGSLEFCFRDKMKSLKGDFISYCGNE